MKFCSACGAQNNEGAAFCSSCGARMVANAPVSSSSEGAPFSVALASPPQATPQPPPSKKPNYVASGCGLLIGAIGLFCVFGSIVTMLTTHQNDWYLVWFGISFIAVTVAIVSRARRIVAIIAAVVLFGISMATAPPPSNSTSSTVASESTAAPIADVATDAPPTDPPPKPTATPESYEHQRAREKREFISSVKESITAAQIAGNPNKYVGDNVDLHCTVTNVPQKGTINASCGDDETNIVVLYEDTNSLDQGQAIRILGTVEEPAEGTNAMGGTMNFPTVKAEFME